MKAYDGTDPLQIDDTDSTQEGWRAQHGFTLVELLVALALFTVVITGMFSFLWVASGNWQRNQNIADMTENARVGMNRMTREMRQGTQVTDAQSSQVSFVVDFGNGPETVTYGFWPASPSQPGSGSVWRSSSSGGGQVTMMENVSSMQFGYFGNDYRCDANGDGTINYSELQGCNGIPGKIARVDIALTMQAGNESQQVFNDQAWLRNRTV